MNALYIFDGTADHERFISSLKRIKGQKKLILCPLTIDQDIICSAYMGMQREKWEVQVVDFTELFNKTAFLIRDEYLRFISEFANRPIFGGKNLKEYFKFPSKNFSVWWFSLVAEKNTLKTDSYHRLVKILSILDIQNTYACKDVWYDVNDREIYDMLRDQEKIKGFKSRNLRKTGSNPPRLPMLLDILLNSFIYFNMQFTKLLMIKLRMAGLNARKEVLNKSKFLLVTYFPLIDREQLTQRKFINRYYLPLQRALERKYRNRFIWLGMNVNLDDYDWNESTKLGKRINKWGYPFYFSEEWLTFRDLCLVFLEYACISLRFFSKSSHLSREFKYLDINIWRIFKKDWYESFYGSVLIQGIVHYHLFSRLFGKLDEKTTVIYFYEMHAWEKALNIAAAEKNVSEVIGIQHTSVPLLLLNYFNHFTELEDEGFIQTVPKPNYLACVGKIPRKLFLESGWDQNKIFILGALRFQHFKRYLERVIPWSSRENKIIVALSIEPKESRELLTYVYHAFRNQAGYKVLIKAHPAMPVQSIMASLNIRLDSDIFEIAVTPLYKLLPTSKAMIVTGSSASLEGIACQCPIIIPRLISAIDMNPFSNISNLPVYVSSPGELKKITDDIINRNDSPLNYEECKKFILDYFEFLGSDEDFLERIENPKQNINL